MFLGTGNTEKFNYKHVNHVIANCLMFMFHLHNFFSCEIELLLKLWKCGFVYLKAKSLLKGLRTVRMSFIITLKKMSRSSGFLSQILKFTTKKEKDEWKCYTKRKLYLLINAWCRDCFLVRKRTLLQKKTLYRLVTIIL